MLGALRHRNYRLFLFGQIVSTVGTWMQTVALPWLALQLTHNGFLVGLVLAAQFLPVLIGSPFAGVIADRYRKRSVLLLTQSAFVAPPFALFALSATGHAEYWMVIIAALGTGTINALDVPTRQAFQVEMVGKQDLMNAIALNSSVFNASAVIGPSIAGLIIAAAGVPVCFLLNSISYLAAIAALLSMRDLPPTARRPEEQPLLIRLAQGLAYARAEPVVGMLLIAVAVFSLFAMNRTTLLPLFADESCSVYSKNDRWWEAGKSFYGGATRRAPGDNAIGKSLKAIDVQTGKIVTTTLPPPTADLQIPMLVTRKGDIVVTNHGAGKLVRVDPASGKVLGSIGEPGSWPGQFGDVGGLAEDASGRIYAADYRHRVIQRFDPNGKIDAVWWATRNAPQTGEGDYE